MAKKRSSGERRVLFTILAVFCCLVAVQVFYGLFPAYMKEVRGERLGAVLERDPNFTAAVEQSQNQAFVLLTFVAQNDAGKSCEILINGVSFGDLQGGVLSLQGREGDEISVTGSKNSAVALLDMPENLAEDFPTSLLLKEEEKFWGIVSLK